VLTQDTNNAEHPGKIADYADTTNFDVDFETKDSPPAISASLRAFGQFDAYNKSQPLDFAVSIIAVAGSAFGTCKSSADIPICSAIARASSSTLPARSLQAASKRSTSSGEGTHPEACPLP
jgi:hypothetical protein